MPNAAAISGRTVITHVLTVVLASAALCSAGAQDVPARPPLVGAEWVHTAVAGESWTTIGAHEGITPAVLAARNGRTLKSPLRAGDIIVIDNRHIVPEALFAPDSDGNGLIVNVPQRLLFQFAAGRLQGHYPIAVGGRDWQTPLGAFSDRPHRREPNVGRPRVYSGRDAAGRKARPDASATRATESTRQILGGPQPR